MPTADGRSSAMWLVVLGAVGSSAPWVCPCSIAGGRSGCSVGQAGCCFLRHEMFEQEGTAVMTVVDFQQEDSHVVRCLFGACPVREVDSSYRREIAPTTQLRRRYGCLGRPVGGRTGAKKGVCTMCTPWAWDRVVLLPDWGGFRGSGVFSRTGGRFESHLGHA